MKICAKRQKTEYPKEIETPSELIDYLININKLHNFKQLTDHKHQQLLDLIQQNSSIYKFRLFENFKLIFYSLTRLNQQYWIDRGWSLDEARIKISELQKDNSEKFTIKKHNHPENYIGINSTQIEYWIKQGYSEDESKNKLKDRQTTFTLQKCLDKYGEIEGYKRWQERQDKWIKTLSLKSETEIKRINLLKNSCDVSGVNINNIDSHLNRLSFTDQHKTIIKQSILNSVNLRTFIIQYLSYTNNNFLFKNIQIIAYSKLIQSYFNCNQSDILREVCLLMEEQDIKTGTFGNIIGYGGLRLKSYGEFLIAQFLDEHNVKYEYEKKYPDSRKRCDFYLNDYDIYVEYTGMSNKKYFKNGSVTERYNDNIKQKKVTCSTKQLNCLFNSKINSIFDSLKKLINGNNEII